MDFPGKQRKLFVVGATVVYDYIFKVDRLPQPGKVARIVGFEQPCKRYYGGTAFNIAVQLAKLGESISIGHPVGYDFPGSEYEGYIRELGVQTDHLQVYPEQSSGFAYLFFKDNGETICFSHPTIAPRLSLKKAVFEQIELIIFTPVIDALDESIFEYTLAYSIPVAIVGVADAKILKLLPLTEVLSLNVDETAILSSAMGNISVKDISLHMPGVLFETHGKKGCNIYRNGQLVGRVSSIPPKQFVDPSGAGDSFSAATLSALQRGFTPIEASQIGSAAASHVIEAFGCQTNIPDWEMISERLSEHDPRLAQKINTK